MKQEFKKLDNEKIEWTYEHEEEKFNDKDFGDIGVTSKKGYIIFESKEKALSVLDRDVSETEKLVDTHKAAMDKNEHSLDTFTDLKVLVEAVGKLHNDFKEIINIPEKLYADNPKKYQKLLREFNSAKDYIKDEMSNINKEYGKYLEYKSAKEAYDFAKEQYDKILEQREQLMNL